MLPVFAPRRLSYRVEVKSGSRTVPIGGGAPVVIQSMTNTPTEDAEATSAQALSLARAGSELVRVTVNTPAAAKAVPEIRERLDAAGCPVPLVGDFHYNGHRLLAEYPDCAASLSKYRINPGNVGKGAKHGENFAAMVELACRWEKPVRIGVNGGSVDRELLARMMDVNRESPEPKPVRGVFLEAIVESAVQSALEAERLGLPGSSIVLSVKMSDVAEMIAVNRSLASRGPWALHLGLTEAGTGTKGVAASSAALAVLLAEGIGDTIRVSITPGPGRPRETEVMVAGELLQSMGLRRFAPQVTSCPGCGRTSNTLFEELAAETQAFLRERIPDWRRDCPGCESMRVAVMGCVVNGPGESAGADIGISLPGRGESPAAPVYIDGRRAAVLKGPRMNEDFKELLERYVHERWGGHDSDREQMSGKA